MNASQYDIKDLRDAREVCIITSGQIIDARTAGARRVLNIARSLAFGNVKVFIFSFIDFLNLSGEIREVQKNVYCYGKTNHDSAIHHRNLNQFLRVSYRYMNKNRSDAVAYLYPTTFIIRDFIFLVYFKIVKGYRFFCEVNELRSSIAFSSSPPPGIFRKLIYLLKSVRDLIIYNVNEWQIPLYDGITVISAALEERFAKQARRLIRIPIICNDVDVTSESTPRFFDGTVFRICFAGYIKIEKEGFDILIESLSKVKETQPVQLYLYGIMSDADSSQLKELSERFGFSGDIFYMGNMDPEILQSEFKKYHLLILPRPLNRRTRYGLSTKLSEYLVSSTPVLVTDVSDNALLIQDNYNGFIIPPGSTEIMTKKISEIIESYNSKAHDMVENAHKTVREKLNYRLFSEQYINFFFQEPVTIKRRNLKIQK